MIWWLGTMARLAGLGRRVRGWAGWAWLRGNWWLPAGLALLLALWWVRRDGYQAGVRDCTARGQAAAAAQAQQDMKRVEEASGRQARASEAVNAAGREHEQAIRAAAGGDGDCLGADVLRQLRAAEAALAGAAAR